MTNPAPRRRRPAPLASALCAVTLAGCVSTVDVRVENDSTHDFTNLRIADVEYGTVAAGTASDYRPVGLRFRYATLRLDAGGVSMTGQVLHFGARSFTYRINVRDLAAGQLDIELVKEPASRSTVPTSRSPTGA